MPIFSLKVILVTVAFANAYASSHDPEPSKSTTLKPMVQEILHPRGVNWAKPETRIVKRTTGAASHIEILGAIFTPII
jgi:hypothetical protein